MFGDTNSDLNAFMNEAVRQLTWAYIQGGVKIALNPDNLASYATYGYYENSGLDAVEKQYAAIGAFIAKLNGELRQRVLTDPSYPLARWQSFAQDVSSDISQQTGFAWDSSYIVNAPSSAVQAARATTTTIGNAIPWLGSALAVYLLIPLIGPIIGGFISRPSHS